MATYEQQLTRQWQEPAFLPEWRQMPLVQLKDIEKQLTQIAEKHVDFHYSSDPLENANKVIDAMATRAKIALMILLKGGPLP